MPVDRKDLAAGSLLLAIALFFFVNAVADLPLGTTFRMGPGYFPVALSGLLALLGIVIAWRAIGRPTLPFGAVSWRGLFLLSAASIVFGLVIPHAGLVPALVLAVLLSAYSSRRMTLRLAIALTVGLTLLCVLLFKYALELPLTLFGAA